MVGVVAGLESFGGFELVVVGGGSAPVPGRCAGSMSSGLWPEPKQRLDVKALEA